MGLRSSKYVFFFWGGGEFASRTSSVAMSLGSSGVGTSVSEAFSASPATEAVMSLSYRVSG